MTLINSSVTHDNSFVKHKNMWNR